MAHRWPWETETLPAVQQETLPAVPQGSETLLEALRQDFAYAVTNTAVKVHSNNPALQFLVNTARGQIIPRGDCKFTNGTVVEFQDIGMCQPGAPYMTVEDLLSKVLETARGLGLEFDK